MSIAAENDRAGAMAMRCTAFPDRVTVTVWRRLSSANAVHSQGPLVSN